MHTVYIEVYKGIRGKWRMGLHTSIYVDGDLYEWAYAGKSHAQSTHGIQYKGVVYERRRQFLYKDWEFWKSVPVGVANALCTQEGGAALRRARARVKHMLHGRYEDGRYHWLENNCWKFCYDLLAAMHIQIPRDTIENMNDERLGVFTGLTYLGFHYALKPLSHIIGSIVKMLTLKIM
tara:strand:+ start:97 stop:630 length:534 start_codon:yes stop_codon:yes gene_type:complete